MLLSLCLKNLKTEISSFGTAPSFQQNLQVYPARGQLSISSQRKVHPEFRAFGNCPPLIPPPSCSDLAKRVSALGVTQLRLKRFAVFELANVAVRVIKISDNTPHEHFFLCLDALSL